MRHNGGGHGTATPPPIPAALLLVTATMHGAGELRPLVSQHEPVAANFPRITRQLAAGGERAAQIRAMLSYVACQFKTGGTQVACFVTDAALRRRGGEWRGKNEGEDYQCAAHGGYLGAKVWSNDAVT